jgi:hypothetical protein
MKENLRKPLGHECPPAVENPAKQPNPPNHQECDVPVPPGQAPHPEEPSKCPEPSCCCKCPTPPGSTSNCLEELVEGQIGDLGAADKAKFKAELVKILETAKKAKQEYTRDKYDELKDNWIKEDTRIADVIRRLECAVWCWECVLECHVCPLLYDLHKAEKWLYDDEKRYDTVHDLYDKRYWLERERAVRQRKLNRIKDVLKAWESPAASIQKAMDDTRKLLDAIETLLGTQPGKAVYDLFFRVIPLHLAIAPPAGIAETQIDKRYTEFCDCGEWGPDDCCGPDIALRGFRERLLPPQAYIINPDDFFNLICCLVDKKYRPANDDLIDADLQLAKLASEIDRYEKAIGPGWQAEFEKNAKAAIPSVIDCCDYEQKHDHDCDKEKYGEEAPKPEKYGQGDPKPEKYGQEDPKPEKYGQENPKPEGEYGKKEEDPPNEYDKAV